MTVTEYINENRDKTIRTNTEDDGTFIGLKKPYMLCCKDVLSKKR